jgi:hypothetical protein
MKKSLEALAEAMKGNFWTGFAKKIGPASPIAAPAPQDPAPVTDSKPPEESP